MGHEVRRKGASAELARMDSTREGRFDKTEAGRSQAARRSAARVAADVAEIFGEHSREGDVRGTWRR